MKNTMMGMKGIDSYATSKVATCIYVVYILLMLESEGAYTF